MDVNIPFLLQVVRRRASDAARPPALQRPVQLSLLRWENLHAGVKDRALLAAAWRYGECKTWKKCIQVGALGSRVL